MLLGAAAKRWQQQVRLRSAPKSVVVLTGTFPAYSDHLCGAAAPVCDASAAHHTFAAPTRLPDQHKCPPCAAGLSWAQGRTGVRCQCTGVRCRCHICDRARRDLCLVAHPLRQCRHAKMSGRFKRRCADCRCGDGALSVQWLARQCGGSGRICDAGH